MKLSYGLPDRLFISGEKVTYYQKGEKQPRKYSLESGGAESGLKNDNQQTSKVLYRLLSGIRTYQFHDTSDTAKIKDRGYVDDARYLRSDAGNLAAFLKMLKEHDDYRKYYDRIVRHIQCVMPQFGDFDLEAIPGNKDYVRLNWKDNKGSDYLFDPDPDIRWFFTIHGSSDFVASTSRSVAQVDCSGRAGVGIASIRHRPVGGDCSFSLAEDSDTAGDAIHPVGR